MHTEATFPAFPPAQAAPRQPGRTAMFCLAILTGLLLALGVIGWWRLAAIDARYSRVLGETAASLNELHEVGLHIFAGYGHIVGLRHAQDPAARAALLRTIAEERAANDRLYGKLKLTLTDPELRAALDNVLAKRAICHQQGNAFIAEAAQPNATLSDATQSLELLHSYLAYQQACDRLSDRIQSVSLQVNRELTREITNLRWLFLGVGILPIACAVLFLIVILSLLRVIKVQGEED